MNNSSSEKRRGAGNTGGSSTHVLRTTAPGQANNSSASGNNSHNSNSRSNIIAPPPRAQLGGTPSSSSSPSPEERNVHAHGANNGSSTPSSRRDSNAPSTGAQASVAAAAAATQLVKEKDLRIAALERELGVMETEFQRELDKLSQNESETASFWQAKHSALNQQFLRTDTELRLMRAELDVREAEREELRAGWETMKREVRERDDEIRDLKAQVRGLKEWVSTSTKADSSTSDEVFGDGMARLGNGLQNWVIVNFRRAKLDILRTNDGAVLQELGQLVPTYEELAQTAKVHLLQSVVSRILVNSIFDAYFVGLSRDEAEQFAQMESLLASIGAPEAVNQWRSQTLTILRKEAPQKMQVQTSQITEEVIIRINRILDAITDTKSTEVRDQALRVLVNSSIELSRHLGVQKAVFQVSMPEILPHQKVMFDHSTMEDIGGEDEESLIQREICCVTFPGIIKRGDETGGHLQFRNVISKARVLCTPE